MGLDKTKGQSMIEKLISEAISEFVWHCRYEKSLNEKTICAYETDLKQFEELSSVNNLADVEKMHIQIWLKAISIFKHKTVKRKLATLKCFFSYIELENDWFNNPLRRMSIKMKESSSLPTVMTIEEIRTILTIVYQKARNGKGQQNYLGIRNSAIIELLFATGIRVDELCKLKNEDVNLISGFIKIHGKGNRDRVVAICQEETITALQKWSNKKNTDSPVFFTNRLNRPISPQNIRQMIHGIVSESNIQKPITPHTFRHTFATLLLEEDVDIRYIQQILGHSSIKTTEIYTHVTTRKQREILLSKHPRMKVKPYWV